MSIAARLLTGASALGFLLALAGCGDEGLTAGFSGGYDKVVYRDPGALPRAAAPNPPPYSAAMAAGGAAEAPTLDAATAPQGVTQEMVEAGQQSFGTVCTACHGAGGAGSAAGPALNDAEWLNVSGSFDEIAALIEAGVPAPVQFQAPMPPRGGGNFTEDQVREIAAYVFALSHQGS